MIKACIQAMILQGLRFQVRLSCEMNLRDRNCAVLVFSDCGCWVVLIMTLDWLLKSSRPEEKQSHLQSGLGVTTIAPPTPSFMARSVAGSHSLVEAGSHAYSLAPFQMTADSGFVQTLLHNP